MSHRLFQVEPIYQPLPLDVQGHLGGPRRLAVQRPGGGRETSVVAQRLHLGRNGQCPAQPLVVDHRALVHLGKAVVGGVGEGGEAPVTHNSTWPSGYSATSMSSSRYSTLAYPNVRLCDTLRHSSYLRSVPDHRTRASQTVKCLNVEVLLKCRTAGHFQMSARSCSLWRSCVFAGGRQGGGWPEAVERHSGCAHDTCRSMPSLKDSRSPSRPRSEAVGGGAPASR